MKIEKEKIVSLNYKMYVAADNGTEEVWEETPERHPLVYCHGMGMMLPAFEAALEGKEEGEEFDFTITKDNAYGEYDPRGVRKLAKKLFYNGDGEFDEERVFEGSIVPMQTEDKQIVNAQVVEVTDESVTIDLNHPLAGEDLHFVGTIAGVRQASESEIEDIRHPKHCCGGCHKNKDNDCENGCKKNDCEDNHCGKCCDNKCNN